MSEILDDLALAGQRRQQEGRALPVGEAHAVERQHAIGEADAIGALAPAAHRIGIARVDALARRRIRPMLIAAKNPAERAHRRFSRPAATTYFLRCCRSRAPCRFSSLS